MFAHPRGISSPRRRVYSILVASAATTLALGISACSASPTDQASGASSTSSASSVNSAAAAATAAITKRPTSIGITVPVGAKIPAGKKIYFVVPNVPSALQMEAPLKAAAAALKWTTVNVNAGTSPESFVAAVNTAIHAKPDGVFIAGIPPAVIQDQLAQLKKLGIPVITLGAPLGNIPPASTGILFNIAGIPYNTAAGVALANWVAADSGGKTSALVIGIPTFPGPLALSTGFEHQMGKACPDCKVYVQNYAASAMGTTLPGSLTGYLRTHPSIKYVVADFDDMFAGVPAALKAAGITDVKLAGNTPSSSDQVNIAAGNFEAAGYMFALNENPWRVIDVFARHFAHKPTAVSANAPLPAWLLIKNNESTWGGPAQDTWPLVANYQEQYKKLWASRLNTHPPAGPAGRPGIPTGSRACR